MEKSIFVDKLKKAIKKSGLTQDKFAIDCEIARSSMMKYLSVKNDVLPPLVVLIKMTEVLKCDPNYLLTNNNCSTQEIQDIHEYTGLSDRSIETLSHLKNGCLNNFNYEETLNMINMILESDSVIDMINPVSNYYRTEVKVNEIKSQPDFDQNREFDYVLGKPKISEMLNEYKKIENEYHPQDAYLIQRKFVDCIEQKAKSDFQNDTVYPIPEVDMKFLEECPKIEESMQEPKKLVSKGKKRRNNAVLSTFPASFLPSNLPSI